MIAGRLRPGTLALDVATWVIVLVLAFPLFWMLSTSLKPPTELFEMPPSLLPRSPTLANFVKLVTQTDFLTYFMNSLIIATATTVVTLVITALGAHALVGFDFPGRRLIARAVLFTYLLPAAVILIPVYLTLARLGLSNTRVGLVIAYTTFVLPFSLWLMRSFMAGIPREIEQAALVDGASRLGAFVDVVLPQALPGIVTTGVFAFVLSWNEYLYALVLINDNARKTLPIGIMTTLASGFNIDWGMLMAVAVLMSVPLMLIFLVLQRHIVRGFGAGAVKA